MALQNIEWASFRWLLYKYLPYVFRASFEETSKYEKNGEMFRRSAWNAKMLSVFIFQNFTQKF